MIVTFFQVKMTMDGGDTKAQFTLEISVFKDKDYLLPYGIKEFPLRVSLSKPLYVQVKSAKLWFTLRKTECKKGPCYCGFKGVYQLNFNFQMWKNRNTRQRQSKKGKNNSRNAANLLPLRSRKFDRGGRDTRHIGFVTLSKKVRLNDIL